VSAKLRETLPLYGSIQPNAERVRSVSARFPGVVRSLRKSVGDDVRAGEVLATIESNESLQTYELTAPIAGVVTARNVNPGETAAESPVFVITDLATVWADLSVFPRDAPKVRIGQTVRVKSTEGSVVSDGRVVHVSAVGSLGSQSVTARALLKNIPRQWTPGLYVTGEVVLGELPVTVAVKNAALQTLDGRTVVFVPTEDGFEPRPIETGKTDGDLTEVVKGLESGGSYVSEGSFVVKAELGKSEAEHDH
jgi:cobalt-zinc-cadmium efflux system membrane fusion protein